MCRNPRLTDFPSVYWGQIWVEFAVTGSNLEKISPVTFTESYLDSHPDAKPTCISEMRTTVMISCLKGSLVLCQKVSHATKKASIIKTAQTMVY